MGAGQDKVAGVVAVAQSGKAKKAKAKSPAKKAAEPKPAKKPEKKTGKAKK